MYHVTRCQRPPGSGATWPASSSVDQRDRDRAGGEPGARGERVDVDRIVPERARGRARRRRRPPARCRRAAGPGPLPAPGRAPPARPARSRRAWRLRGSGVTAFRKRRMDRAGNREHVAALLRGEARGDERADDSVASTTSTPRARPLISAIAAGKILLAAAACPAEFARARPPSAADRVREVAIALPDRRGRVRCRRPRCCCRRRQARRDARRRRCRAPAR